MMYVVHWSPAFKTFVRELAIDEGQNPAKQRQVKGQEGILYIIWREQVLYQH
jgi:hypothetical protein